MNNRQKWINLEIMAKDVYVAAIRADMPALISKVRLLQAHLPQIEAATKVWPDNPWIKEYLED